MKRQAASILRESWIQEVLILMVKLGSDCRLRRGRPAFRLGK